jgi:hypothetical protein
MLSDIFGIPEDILPVAWTIHGVILVKIWD